MTKWKYTYRDWPDDQTNLHKDLATCGDAGWELVGMMRFRYCVRYYFKRLAVEGEYND